MKKTEESSVFFPLTEESVEEKKGDNYSSANFICLFFFQSNSFSEMQEQVFAFQSLSPVSPHTTVTPREAVYQITTGFILFSHIQ